MGLLIRSLTLRYLPCQGSLLEVLALLGGVCLAGGGYHLQGLLPAARARDLLPRMLTEVFPSIVGGALDFFLLYICLRLEG